MLRMFKQSGSAKHEKDRDSGAESDYSVEFKSGFVANGIIDTSGPLWGPGIRVQQTSSVTTQRPWHHDNLEAEGRSAADELDKLYASLPDEAFEMTLKDLVDGRKASPRVSPEKDSEEPPRLGKKSSTVEKGAAREDGEIKPKNKIHGHPALSLSFQLPHPSPNRDTSSAPNSLSPRHSPGRQTLSAHFTAENNSTPPRSPHGMSSPRMSFSEYGMGMVSQSYEAEIVRTASPDLQIFENRHSQFSSEDRMSPRQTLFTTPAGSRSPNLPLLVPYSNDCSVCSATNLVFKTRCMVCGKAYCSRCVRTAMGTMPEGRKCKYTCVGRPINPRFLKKAGSGCWPFGFSNSEAKMAEKSERRRQAAVQSQDFDMQRRNISSSYPPQTTSPRPGTHGAPPHPSVQLSSPLPSTERASPHPRTQRASQLPRAPTASPLPTAQTVYPMVYNQRASPLPSGQSLSPRSTTHHYPQNSYQPNFMGVTY